MNLLGISCGFHDAAAAVVVDGVVAEALGLVPDLRVVYRNDC